jgi:hypothetical protein
MDIFRLLLGIAMLTMGRRLYWLFLGGIGFVFGYDIAKQIIHGQPQTVIFVIALCAGVAGAMLAVMFQKFAVLIGGFLAGGYLFVEFMKELGAGVGNSHWLLFILGGVIGALLMKVLFSWALIVLSSFMGAVLILRAFHFGTQPPGLIFILLFLLGIAVQGGLLGRNHPPHR